MTGMTRTSGLRVALPISLFLLIYYLAFVLGAFPLIRLSMQLSNAAPDDYILYLDTGDGYNERNTIRR